jgi:hypothetical protein
MRVANNHSDDAAKFAADTSFLVEGVVPRVLASLDIASIVMTGRLCRCRWDAGVDCVRAWCGPFVLSPRAPAVGVDEPERKPCLDPTANAGGRPSVRERPCVGTRGSGAGRCSSESRDSDELGAWMDAARPRLPTSSSNSGPCASGGASDDARSLRGGA